MSLVFRQMGVYLKALVGLVLIVFLIVFFVANHGNKADIWMWWQLKAVATNWVVLLALLAGVILWWLGWWMMTLPGQWRSMRRDERSRELPSQERPAD